MADPADFYWKQHDTAPACEFAFTDLLGNVPPGNLTGASVKFIMRATGSSGSPKINSTGTIVNPTNWLLGYQPAIGDTDTAGAYQGEFQVTYADGTKQTFPDPGYLNILITADLDNA